MKMLYNLDTLVLVLNMLRACKVLTGLKELNCNSPKYHNKHIKEILKITKTIMK